MVATVSRWRAEMRSGRRTCSEGGGWSSDWGSGEDLRRVRESVHVVSSTVVNIYHNVEVSKPTMGAGGTTLL